MGPRKPPLCFWCWAKKNAAKLASFFSKDEINKVVAAAGSLGSLSPVVINEIVREFGKKYAENGIPVSSDTLSQFFDGTEQSNDNSAQNENQAGIDVTLLDPQVVKNFFENEPPQISALLLQRLDDEMAIKIISELEPQLRNELFQAYLEQNKMEEDLQLEFETDLIEMLHDTKLDEGNAAEIEKTANLINQFSTETSDELVKYFEEIDADVAASIKKIFI